MTEIPCCLPIKGGENGTPSAAGDAGYEMFASPGSLNGAPHTWQRGHVWGVPSVCRRGVTETSPHSSECGAVTPRFAHGGGTKGINKTPHR